MKLMHTQMTPSLPRSRQKRRKQARHLRSALAIGIWGLEWLLN